MRCHIWVENCHNNVEVLIRSVRQSLGSNLGFFNFSNIRLMRMVVLINKNFLPRNAGWARYCCYV